VLVVKAVFRVPIFSALLGLAPLLAAGAVFGARAASAADVAQESIQSASPSPTRSAETQATLGVTLGSHTLQSGPTSGTIAGAEISADWHRQFRPELSADLALDLFIETGAMRARYNEEFAPRQFARLRQASLAYQPFSWAVLGAGAQDQSVFGSKLLFQRQSFPALTQSFTHKIGKFSLGARLEQSIASDTSNRQPWGNWPTGLPTFFIEQIHGQWNFSEAAHVSASLGHFAYRNFSGPSSFQAQFLGNTVNGTAAADARFVYAYQGFVGGFAVQSPEWGIFSIQNQSEVVWNHEAPSGKNLGFRARLSPQWRLGAGTALLFHAEYFQVQSDATLALYQPREFGHTNRNGFLVGVETRFTDPALKIAAEWIESKPLIDQPWQSPMSWLQLTLKTDYDLL
jgi:hypothetical protein